MVELRTEGVLEDPVGRSEPGLHVTQLEPEHRLDVRVRSLGRGSVVGPGVLVQDRRAVLDGLDRIEDGRDILVLDVDQRQSFFRAVGVEGADYGAHRADESDALTRQERHVEHAPSDQNVRKIPGREHGQDAGEGLGLGRVDPEDPRVRQRAPEGFPPDQPGERHVSRIASLAADLLDAVEPSDRLPYDAVSHQSPPVVRPAGRRGAAVRAAGPTGGWGPQARGERQKWPRPPRRAYKRDARVVGGIEEVKEARGRTSRTAVPKLRGPYLNELSL